MSRERRNAHQPNRSPISATPIVAKTQADMSATPPDHISKSTMRTQGLPAHSVFHGIDKDSSRHLDEPYRYLPLPNLRHIRLLRLLPHHNESAPLHCQLFDYPMVESGERSHMYEALSYVWGSSKKPRSLVIDGRSMSITANLHEVLLRLRDKVIERILWIDAICIDQSNIEERGDQIQNMAEIYCKANRVIVWLGENANDSDQALKAIRSAADEESPKSPNNDKHRQAILAILERPWFRRIWVLQEVAAAQHIVIMCGSTRVDGYAFCLGLPSALPYEAIPSHIRSVTYLMRGAIFRPKYSLSPSGHVSLDIRPLGGLIDMYHSHEATERHDKVFALLGMSSDNPTAAGLSTSYTTPWNELMAQLVMFILGRQVLVKTWNHQQAAVIFGKGYVIGMVTSVHTSKDAHRGESQYVNINLRDIPGPSWSIQATTKPIKIGDLFCQLLGASKPMVIRPHKDYFSVIMVEFSPPNDNKLHNADFRLSKKPKSSSIHDFLLVWDWHTSDGEMPNQQYATWASDRESEYLPEEASGFPDKQTRLWNTALIISDAGSSDKAVINTLQEMRDTWARKFGEADQRTLTCMGKLALAYGRTGQLWQAEIEFWRMAWSKKKISKEDEDFVKDLSDFEAMWKSQGHIRKAKHFEKTADLVKKVGSRPLAAAEIFEVIKRIDEELTVLLIERRLRVSRLSRRRRITEEEDRRNRQEIEQQFSRKSYTITNIEGLLIEALKKGNVEATYLLLCQDRISVTQEMLLVAIRSEDSSALWCLLGREKGDVQITEKVVLAAAAKSNESVLQYLLERHGGEIHITEKVLMMAVRNEERSVLIYLLEKWNSRVRITQEVAIAAAKNEGFPALKILLREKKNEIELTEGVVVAAAYNREKSVLHSLLQERGNEIQITKKVIVAAKETENTFALRYIYDRGKEILKSQKE